MDVFVYLADAAKWLTIYLQDGATQLQKLPMKCNVVVKFIVATCCTVTGTLILQSFSSQL